MAYSNSVLNPIIYAGFNENFKQGKHQWNTCKILQKKPVNLKQFIPKMVGLYTHEVIWSVSEDIIFLHIGFEHYRIDRHDTQRNKSLRYVVDACATLI